MLEGFSRDQDREVRDLYRDFALQGLGIYGFASLIGHLGAPTALSMIVAFALFGVMSALWMGRRWEVGSIEEEGLIRVERRISGSVRMV